MAWLPLILSPSGLGWIRFHVPIETVVPGAFAPTIAALIVQWLTKRDLRICQLIGSWPRFFLGLAVSLALIVAGYVVIPALAITKSIRLLHWKTFLSPSAYDCNFSTFFGGPVNEEPGWRGFALPRLQARFGHLGAALTLGVLWAGWHLPLFLIHGWSGLPVWAYVIMMTGLSVLMTFAFNISRSSILVSIWMHAIFNTCFILLLGLLANAPLRPHSLLIYLASILVLPLAIIVCTRGQLGLVKRN
jgi:membrane protease YdiL (CAAX protease family)